MNDEIKRATRVRMSKTGECYAVALAAVRDERSRYLEDQRLIDSEFWSSNMARANDDPPTSTG